MRSLKQLEAAALEAHARGTSWAQFWGTIANEVGQFEPYNISRHRKLVARLLSVVVSGDAPKQIGADDPSPWVQDDAAPSDCETQARCLWPGRGAKSLARP